METNKGYVVLEVGWQYNDEYHHTGNYGVTYEAPKKFYTKFENAVEEYKKQNFEMLRTERLCKYTSGNWDSLCNKGMADQFRKLFLEEFEIDVEEDYDFRIPKTATDEQLTKILECLKIKFFEIVEIEID